MSRFFTATEHYCTLFSHHFLPMGMALHQSLMRHAQPFHLWILCVDEVVEQQLRRINLPHVSLIAAHTIETPDLRAVRQQRTLREYCWTLTPFVFDAVLYRAPDIEQVTYLDADLYFFDSPRQLLDEFAASGKIALLTEHAPAPEYQFTAISGRFCVQFNTFRRDPQAAHMINWWQAQCLTWCFDRLEATRYGDQKYLDQWPSLFPHAIHIVQQTQLTLAPWNARFILEHAEATFKPVFYHFAGLRLVQPGRVRLFKRFKVGERVESLYYDPYVHELLDSIQRLKAHQITIPYHVEPINLLRRLSRWVRRSERHISVPH